MKTLIFIELDRLLNGQVHFEISEGMAPTVGHFGPRTELTSGLCLDLNSALAEIVKRFALHPDLIGWDTDKE